MHFVRNRIMVTTLIGSDSVDFLLDTGCAEGLAIISDSLASRYGMGTNTTQDTDMSYHLNKQGRFQLMIDSCIFNYNYVVSNSGLPTIGISNKGMNSCWSINFRENRLQIIPCDSMVNSDALVFPIEIVNRMPVARIPMIVYREGKSHVIDAEFLVDTGTPYAFCITDPSKELFHYIDIISHSDYEDEYSSTLKRRGQLRTHTVFKIDSIHIRDKSTLQAFGVIDIGMRSAKREFGPNVVGTIGMGLLKDFNMIFDYREKRLILIPHNLIMPVYEQSNNSLGFKNSASLRISFVEIGHSAYLVGIKPADQIISINGITADRLTISTMDSLRMLPDGSNIKLKVQRGPDELEFDYNSFTTLK